MKITLRGTAFGMALISTTLLTACFSDFFVSNLRGGVSSSIVDYLYPRGETPPAQDDIIPTLTLPLRVGIAFVPSSHREGLSPTLQAELLGKVKAAFEKEKFIKEIVVIPDSYLANSRGFSGLEQVSRLFTLDVVALVSYDQVTNITDNKASLVYWTIVGAYLIKGTEQATQTFLDTAIFDVRTQKLLFRAPGISRSESTTTLVDAEAKGRQKQQAGFEMAVEDLNKNLATELASFREKVKNEKAVNIVDSTGNNGGALGLALLPVLMVLAVFARRRARVS